MLISHLFALKLDIQFAHMKARVIAVCLALVPLVLSCKLGYSHRHYTSTRTTSTANDEEYTQTFLNDNGREECSYSFKTKEYGYRLKSNGPIKINNRTVEKLRHGQIVDLVITEDGREYPYTICNGLTGTKVTTADGSLTETDEARVRKALEKAQKQISGNQQQASGGKR